MPSLTAAVRDAPTEADCVAAQPDDVRAERCAVGVRDDDADLRPGLHHHAAGGDHGLSTRLVWFGLADLALTT